MCTVKFVLNWNLEKSPLHTPYSSLGCCGQTKFRKMSVEVFLVYSILQQPPEFRMLLLVDCLNSHFTHRDIIIDNNDDDNDNFNNTDEDDDGGDREMILMIMIIIMTMMMIMIIIISIRACGFTHYLHKLFVIGLFFFYFLGGGGYYETKRLKYSKMFYPFKFLNSSFVWYVK